MYLTMDTESAIDLTLVSQTLAGKTVYISNISRYRNGKQPSLSESYRPIALTSYVGKTMER